MPQPWMLLEELAEEEEEESIVHKIDSAKPPTFKAECIYCHWIDKVQMFLVSTWKLEIPKPQIVSYLNSICENQKSGSKIYW